MSGARGSAQTAIVLGATVPHIELITRLRARLLGRPSGLSGRPAGAHVRCPAIVKPADSTGSKSVRRVVDDASLRAAVREALTVSSAGAALIEDFVVGEELQADFLVRHGEPKLLLIRETLKIPEFASVGAQQVLCLPMNRTDRSNKCSRTGTPITDH